MKKSYLPTIAATCILMIMSLAQFSGVSARDLVPYEPVVIDDPNNPGTGVMIIPLVDDGSSGAKSDTAFHSFVRYPSEWDTQYFEEMTDNIAYTRDLLFGGQASISSPADGETWHCKMVRPDGLTATWNKLTFYENYEGQTNCFMTPNWVEPLCNVTSILMTWYTGGQCGPKGTWTMTFYNDDVVYYEGSFEVYPRIPPTKPSGEITVPRYNQGSCTDAYDNICRTGTSRNSYPCDGRQGEVPWTVAGKGCAMTSACMVMAYHGVSVTPAGFNTWCKSNKGYDLNGNIFWNSVNRYSALQGEDKTVSFRGFGGNLKNLICTYGPQIISVKNNGHWVTAIGQVEDESTYIINDPAGGVETTLNAYSNTYKSIRAFSGPEHVFVDTMCGITIRYHSPGELIISDSDGRMTGYDPDTGVFYNEIPQSNYEYIALLEPGEDYPPDYDIVTKSLEIIKPPDGLFSLDVIGTGTGTYDLEIHAFDLNGNPSSGIYRNVPIAPGDLHNYEFLFKQDGGSEIPTPFPPTGTPSPAPPTETPTAAPPTDTPAPPTETPTPAPPTETPTPAPPTETPTPAPPTETPTPVPPTETPTPVPPTDTPTPETPTNTPTFTPTSEPTNTPAAVECEVEIVNAQYYNKQKWLMVIALCDKKGATLTLWDDAGHFLGTMTSHGAQNHRWRGTVDHKPEFVEVRSDCGGVDTAKL